MTFTITYRTPDGKKATLELDAASRDAIWPVLKERGISAISVTEGAAKPGGKGPGLANGLIAGLLVAGLAVAAYFLFVSTPNPNRKAERQASSKIQTAQTTQGKIALAPTEETHKEKVLRIRREMNEQVRPFISKSPTNKVNWVVAPLDPDDPDNALRTSIARDIGTLLSIPPGEEIPPCIPFNFMFEDDAIEAAAARGEKVVTTDGGNRQFLDELKKWKVTIKQGDSDARVAAKNQLIDAQLELLKGIDEGTSVNDAIRAAYQFRVEAAKTRKNLMKSIRDLHSEDHDVETTRALVKKVNEQLEAEGIIPIREESIIPDEDYAAAAEQGEEK